MAAISYWSWSTGVSIQAAPRIEVAMMTAAATIARDGFIGGICPRPLSIHRPGSRPPNSTATSLARLLQKASE
jgi:hypothetical protein